MNEATGEEPRVTPLIDEHRKLGARFADFAGWEMPVWYAGASEEHAAVRKAAGLFDIGHMGVIEVAGAEAGAFLDVVTTGSMSGLKLGRCRYTFVLAHDGLPVDDIIVYRLGAERFLAVVNAANSARVWQWLSGLASGETALDASDPGSGRDFDMTLRDLTAAELGDERLCGMALQGPASANVLAEMIEPQAEFMKLPRLAVMEATLLGVPAIVSRTGYTGEAVGYEVFVAADEAPRVWREILTAGEAAGVQPAGLAARDSLRIEAGLPLFGHELAGPHEITPQGGGYARFVEMDRGFFVGRAALAEREEQRIFEIVRFELDSNRARAVRGDDIAGSRRGQMVGWVSSCAAVGDGQVGLAWVDRKVAREGGELLLYPARHLERSADLSDAAALMPGDQLPIYEAATVLPRFPQRS